MLPTDSTRLGLIDGGTCALVLSEEGGVLNVSMLLLYDVPGDN